VFVHRRVDPLPRLETCRFGILEHVAQRRGEVLLVLDGAARETVGPEVPGAAVTRIEALRVATVDVLHAGGEVFDRRGDDQVVVRSEDAERDQLPAEEFDAVEEEVEEPTAVVVVAEGRRAVDAARPGVKEPVGEERAKLARHASTVAGTGARRGLRRRSLHFRDEGHGSRGHVSGSDPGARRFRSGLHRPCPRV
jgi:hypothetical protein